MIPKKEEKRLKALDRVLIKQFERGFAQAGLVSSWQNQALGRSFAKLRSDVATFDSFQRGLERRGLFDIRIERHRWRDLDGKKYTHVLARAAVTDMWPMGTQYWLRDNAIIGGRFIRLSSGKRRKIGKELILSGMNFISSCAQLDRVRAILLSEKKSFIESAANWPSIFAGIRDNLSCQRSEAWPHKQDAWQILVWHLLDAIEEGAIMLSELTPKNRQFLGYIIPFLAKVSFWKSENSGSWEEAPAVRSSVRAWEHRLIVRLEELSRRREFAFLKRDFERARRHLGASLRRKTLSQAVSLLDRQVTQAMLRDLPFESPRYKRADIRYREADAALLYLLEVDYPSFLASRTGKDIKWAAFMEKRILGQVLSLHDNRSGGIYRYAKDTYQRHGFFRNLTTARLSEKYGAPSGDASGEMEARNRIVPRGRQAAWTHFVWQLSAWAGRRFHETGKKEYLRLHERFFEQGLRLVTGNAKSIDLDAKGKLRVISIPPWKMPECYISDTGSRGAELVFPSPHTPLNWATAEMLFAFEVRRGVLAD